MTDNDSDTLVIEIAVGSRWSDQYFCGQHIEVTGVLSDVWQVRYRRWDGECYGGDETRCAVGYFLSNYRPATFEVTE